MNWGRLTRGLAGIMAGGGARPKAAIRGGEVLIYGVVGDSADGLDAQALTTEIGRLGKGAGDTLVVRINSPGGYVYEGLAIYNYLRKHPARIVVMVDGVAASMASAVAMAGDDILVAENAVVMVHNPWDASIGDAAELRKKADQLDTVGQSLVDIYAGRTGLSSDQVRAMMAETTWMTAAEAIELGFATGLGEPQRAAASLCRDQLARYFEPPERITARLDAAACGRAIPHTDESEGTMFGRGRRDAAVQPAQPQANGAAPTRAGAQNQASRPSPGPGTRAGASLAARLNDLIDEQVDDNTTRADIVERMARAAGIAASTVNSILNAEINCPPLERLQGFAEALGTNVGTLREAAERDGCEYGETSARALGQASASGGWPPQSPPPTQPAGDPVAAERARVQYIMTRGRAAGVDQEVIDQLIRDGVQGSAVDARIVDAWAAAGDPGGAGEPQRNAHRITGGDDDRTRWLTGATNRVLAMAGVRDLVAQHARQADPSAAIDLDPGEFRGLTMLDLARECLDRAGVRTRGLSGMELLQAAMQPRAAGYQTTGDFVTLLENVTHKVLQAAYATTPDTWSRFCARGSVTDFRPHNRYKMGVFSKLDTLTESGQFKNKALGDAEKELLTASTRGNIIAISRQALISDDLSAFSRVATMIGRAARLSVEVDVYDLLAQNGGAGPTMQDGKAMFHADHKNIAGTAGGPSVATFEDARVKMGSQRDPWDNDYLSIVPAVWLGPLGLGGTARVVNDAQYDPDTANKLQKPNAVRGLFGDIVDTPRLSGSAWYAFAGPAIAPAIEVAFLDGESAPFLEAQDGWRTDGVEWKARLDYGVAAIDHRGALRNPGQ